MMKRIAALLLSLLCLFSACAAEDGTAREEELQRKYAQMSGCAAGVSVRMAGEEESRCYKLAFSHDAQGTHLTVREPEALSGITATVGNDDGLTLAYDGMVLDAGAADPVISAVNAVPLLLRAAAEGYIVERNTESWAGQDALRLCMETELDGAPLLVTAYFDEADAPLYAELEREGKITAYLEFTDFTFGDIIFSE